MSRVRIDELLDAYDTELRTDAETPSAVDVMPLGPLRLVTFPGGRSNDQNLWMVLGGVT